MWCEGTGQISSLFGCGSRMDIPRTGASAMDGPVTLCVCVCVCVLGVMVSVLVVGL